MSYGSNHLSARNDSYELYSFTNFTLMNLTRLQIPIDCIFFFEFFRYVFTHLLAKKEQNVK